MSCSPFQILLTSCVALILNGHLSAQPLQPADPDTDSLSWYIQMKYGLDQELFNGFQYYERYVQYKGDPFFPENSFYMGSVTLKGIQYDDLQLKYDSYSQHLILEYTDFKNSYNQLIINSIHADSFRFGTYLFQKLSISGEEPVFYQVLNSGPVTCYVHWRKSITFLNFDSQYTYKFTAPIGKYYIKYGGRIQPFTNRKSFISIFPDSLQPEIKRYCRHERLSLRKADSSDIQQILDFICSCNESLSGH